MINVIYQIFFIKINANYFRYIFFELSIDYYTSTKLLIKKNKLIKITKMQSFGKTSQDYIAEAKYK